MNDTGAPALPPATGARLLCDLELRQAALQRHGPARSREQRGLRDLLRDRPGDVPLRRRSSTWLRHQDARIFVAVRLELEEFPLGAELFYPGRIDIGTRVLGIGRSSFRLGQGIFNGNICAATAETVLVLMDEATRKAKALTPQLRAWLEQRLAKPAQHGQTRIALALAGKAASKRSSIRSRPGR